MSNKSGTSVPSGSHFADALVKAGFTLAVVGVMALAASGASGEYGGWWRVIGWVGIALLADSVTCVAIGILARRGRDTEEAYRLGYDLGYERGYAARDREDAA
jgi:hypothetical protein